MRLIDADALVKEISVSHTMTDDCGIKTGYEISMRLVEDAPTIEPRPRGKWEEKGIAFIRDTNIERVQEMRCSKCKRWLTTSYMYYLTQYKFCPNCGADMRGKAE